MQRPIRSSPFSLFPPVYYLLRLPLKQEATEPDRSVASAGRSEILMARAR